MTGRTTLIIAHRLSTISLADRVAVRRGRTRRSRRARTQELLATEPRYVEILAQTEQEVDAPVAGSGNGNGRADRNGDRRLIEHEVAVDVAESRHLDEDIGIDIGQPTPYDDRREGVD